MSSVRHHFVLVPGFAAFDAFGPFEYYHGVADVFRRSEPDSSPHNLHFFVNVPSASVSARAKALGLWLAQRIDWGVIQPKDAIHLVGHSTGGLDIRQLVRSLSDAGSGCPFPRLPIAATDILQRLRTIQFISTPHRGTNLARYVRAMMPLPQVLLRAAFFAVRFVGAPMNVVHTVRSAHQIGDGFEQALERDAFYAVLRWLNEMATDFNAICDLHPVMPGRDGPDNSPISRSDEEDEVRLYDPFKVRSIVTVAEPTGSGSVLFSLLDRLMQFQPPESLGQDCMLGPLLESESPKPLHRQHHDGLVNSVSMVWPDADHSVVVRADHGDIIGHYGLGFDGVGYDLLDADTGFASQDFSAVWQQVRHFAIVA